MDSKNSMSQPGSDPGATVDQYIPEPNKVSCEQDQPRVHAWPVTIEIKKRGKVSSRNGAD